MVIQGKIKKITSSPQFKHQRWWVNVDVVTDKNEEHKTFVCANTKLEVIKASNIGNTISFAV